ncbi:unnamed protein product [Spirodela intermedia]|uniref:Uncharacterized protein n=1 Tax=Spirodela intermedia TaxID=51605 RepID=A0A7I8LA89_SPIIN|nr:unnamed protein product [Spirodela intermedia]
MEIDQHFIKEKLDEGIISTPYMASHEQLADVLTKGLSDIAFQHLIFKLGLDDIHSPT